MAYGYRVALKYLGLARAVGTWERVETPESGNKNPDFWSLLLSTLLDCSVFVPFANFIALPSLPERDLKQEINNYRRRGGKNSTPSFSKVFLFSCVFSFHFTICCLASSASVSGLSLSIFHLTDCRLICWVFLLFNGWRIAAQIFDDILALLQIFTQLLLAVLSLFWSSQTSCLWN